MNCTEVKVWLNDYVDNDLPANERQEVEQHLEQCSDCREELKSLRWLQQETAALPRSISPPHDLWSGVEERIAPQQALVSKWKLRLRHRRNGMLKVDKQGFGLTSILDFGQRAGLIRRLAPVAAALVIVIGAFLLLGRQRTTTWDVARIEGTPRVGSMLLTSTGRLEVGEWLETDAASRARIAVGLIGHVEVEPNTRVRLVEAKATDHRLALPRGTIHARISAPPRLFFVETPSALAVDLGCEYTLHVDSTGGSLLQVTAGWVSLEFGGRESIVPAGAACTTRPGFGPGTPFLQDASEKFQIALGKFDFENGDAAALDTVLAEARNMDSITLWHLLFRTSDQERARVYDRLAALVPAPEGVTREGVLRGDPEMIKAWQKHLNLGMKPWWKFWQ